MNDYANAAKGLRHVFVHGLKLKASIGIFDDEKARKQVVIISVDLVVTEGDAHNDQIENVVCYKKIVNDIEELIGAGHVLLVETLAEQIADKCLETDDVMRVLVKVEKPEAFIHAASVGVTVERVRH
ncbi:MAG: dihydroneopterin aldolase [Rhizobiales bacterium]|nr:dihydroneopterin aldolase [Hyphomicrobiales bacterium]